MKNDGWRTTVSFETPSGCPPSKGVRAGSAQAIRDPRLYLLRLMQNKHLSACSFSKFFPTVVRSLGFGAVGILVGYTSDKFNERTWRITVPMGAALTGFIISCATLNIAARHVACFLFASGAYAVNSIILGWVFTTLGQTTEKKAVSLLIFNVTANVSPIYTAYLYPKNDGPKYLTAMASNSGLRL